MDSYIGFINKLQLDLLASIHMYVGNSKFKKEIDELDRIVGENQYLNPKSFDRMYEILDALKNKIFGGMSLEERDKQSKDPISDVNLYIEIKRFCWLVVESYKLLNNIFILENVVSSLNLYSRKETINFLNGLVSDLNNWILNVKTDGKKLEEVYMKIEKISEEFKKHSNDNIISIAMSACNNIYFILKSIYVR